MTMMRIELSQKHSLHDRIYYLRKCSYFPLARPGHSSFLMPKEDSSFSSGTTGVENINLPDRDDKAAISGQISATIIYHFITGLWCQFTSDCDFQRPLGLRAKRQAGGKRPTRAVTRAVTRAIGAGLFYVRSMCGVADLVGSLYSPTLTRAPRLGDKYFLRLV